MRRCSARASVSLAPSGRRARTAQTALVVYAVDVENKSRTEPADGPVTMEHTRVVLPLACVRRDSIGKGRDREGRGAGKTRDGWPVQLLRALCRRWQTCNMSVNADFQPDYLLDYGDLLPPMLADGVRVLIYVGLEVLLKPEARLAFPGCKPARRRRRHTELVRDL